MQLEKILYNTKQNFQDFQGQKKMLKQNSFTLLDKLLVRILNSKSFNRKLDSQFKKLKQTMLTEIVNEIQKEFMQATRSSDELEKLKTSKQTKKQKQLKKNCTIQIINPKKTRKTHKNKKKDTSQRPQKINFTKLKQKLKIETQFRLNTGTQNKVQHSKKNTNNLKSSKGKSNDQLSLNLKSKNKIYQDIINKNTYFDIDKNKDQSCSELDKIESESVSGESEYYDVNVGYSSSNQVSQSQKNNVKSFIFDDFQNEEISEKSQTTNPFKRELSQNLSNSDKREKFSFKMEPNINSIQTQKHKLEKKGSLFERRESFSPAGGVIFHFAKVTQK